MNKEQPDLFRISDAVFDRLSKLGYESMTQPERVFLCVWELEAEVNNGGFDQYYFNSAGDNAVDAVQSLAAIGAMKTAEVVKSVNSLFGADGPSPDRHKRQEQLLNLAEASIEKMIEADARFLKYDDNLEELLSAYVSKNGDGFLSK